MFTKTRYKSRLDKLIADWTEYRGMVLNRLGAKGVGAAEERRFLQLKGRLAEEITAVTLDLAPGTAQEVHAHLRAIDNLLNRFPSLMAEAALDERVRTEFDRDWHDHFLFFNRLKSVRPQSKGTDPRSAAQRYTSPSEGVRERTGGARFGIILVRILLLVGLAWAVIRFVPWYRWTGGGPGVHRSGFEGYLAAAITGVRQAAADLKLSTLGGILDPVVEQYGTEATTILVAVLLLAVGYWIFVRMK
jgi:hypothetical protein